MSERAGPLAIVTGAAGFIGGHVARALAADYEVIGVGRGTPREEISLAALLDLTPRLSLVVHCAGGASVARSVQGPLEDFDKTVPPLVQMLELIRAHAPTARLVLMSSAAVYGAATQFPTPEDSAFAPISPYGVHKRISEELCLSWARSYGVSCAIVRLFSVYGAGLRKQLLWDACKKARRGERGFMGTGDELRDWLHVSDATRLIVLASTLASTQAPILNGASGQGTSVRDIVTQVFRHFAVAAPEFSGMCPQGDPPRYLADIARARAAGWSPTIAITDGINEYVKWFEAEAGA